MSAIEQAAVCPICGPGRSGTCEALVRHGTEPPECGHSACRQHWIETGDGECVACPDCDGRGGHDDGDDWVELCDRCEGSGEAG